MLSYDMGKRGNASRYDYLYRRIRHDIAHGNILPDEKLPSKRALARNLGVSVITVEAAYAQLIAEGYVRAEERRGYFACELSPVARGGNAGGNAAGNVTGSAAETTCAGAQRLAASPKTRFGGLLPPLRAWRSPPSKGSRPQALRRGWSRAFRPSPRKAAWRPPHLRQSRRQRRFSPIKPGLA